MHSKDQIESILTECDQLHLLKYWDDLNDDEKNAFQIQLSNIDFKESIHLFNRAQKQFHGDVGTLGGKMEPLPAELFGSEEKTPKTVLEQYMKIGLQEITQGHVAALVLAGGQATRLGVRYPKGMFSVGLPSGKTLFQIQAERIRSVSNLAEKLTEKRGNICWYIMTSSTTHDKTVKYFEDHNYFGLDKNSVIFFEQHSFPCFDFNGKIILDEKHRVASAPEGNGGIYSALRHQGILQHMKKRGIRFIHVHSIDNILVKVADPIFVGYCVMKQADCGTKVIRKLDPNEAVGVVCRVDGQFQVVEYSEISNAAASLRNPDASLVFSAGSICNHFFSLEFLFDIAHKHECQLKLHIVKKKIPYINEMGQKIISPDGPNGIKIEKFIFDAFVFSSRFVTWEVPRCTEFSALKNSDDLNKDSSVTSRRDLLNLHKTYIEQAGGIVDCEEVEISPLLSYAGENLESKVKGNIFNARTVILSDMEEMIIG